MLDLFTTDEKRAVKHAVTEELERYRIAKELGHSVEIMESVIEKLPDKERFLIKERYMQPDSDYITDQQIFNFKFVPAISANGYVNIRNRAMIKIALKLGIDCGFDLKKKLNLM